MIPRLIPALTIVDEKLVRTKMFKNPSYVGDPINAVKIFNEKGADELIVFDIGRDKNIRSREGLFFLQSIADRAFMPLAYGGGLSDIDDARAVIDSGYDKLVISCRQVINHGFQLIEETARLFGSQSVAVAIDVDQNIFGAPKLRGQPWYKRIKNVEEFARNFVKAGAGELIVRDIARCGVNRGPNLDLLQSVSSSVEVPVVCAGGIRDMEDVNHAILAGAHSVSASNFFVYHGNRNAVLITYPERSQLDTILGVYSGSNI